VAGSAERHRAMTAFLEDLVRNPSPMSVEAFARWIDKKRHPVTDRGTFLAYKRVTSAYRDCHTGNFDNSPGQVVEMPRERVDSNQRNTCSTGFHVCSHDYLGNFAGARDLVVEIAPSDVVAVPPDYEFTKMRVCKYRVICDLEDFKRLVLEKPQDVLGGLPFFKTAQLDGRTFGRK
jgi:hypothetical protein